MSEGRSYRFTHTISRLPGETVVKGLRAEDMGDPDAQLFQDQVEAYVAALGEAGVATMTLDPLDDYPDSVFIEDAAVCVGRVAIPMRPGAPTRFGEAKELRSVLESTFDEVLDLDSDGFVDGGDVLLTDTDAFIGLSDRTDEEGFRALGHILADYGYTPRKVVTPADVLHFKSDCGLLDSETIFATGRLADSGCFGGYRLILTPEGEEAAANLIRVNETVFLGAGFPRSEETLSDAGFELQVLDTSEAAKLDGGLSCLSLRFHLG